MVLLNSNYRTDNVKVGRMSGLPAVSVVRHEKALSNLKYLLQNYPLDFKKLQLYQNVATDMSGHPGVDLKQNNAQEVNCLE